MNETVDSLLIAARRALAEAPHGPSGREAYLLLGAVLELSEVQLMTRGERPVGDEATERFRRLLARRLAGEPVAYLLGEREFYGRSFRVDSRVLIPRPETEHLVEAALAVAPGPAPRILDLGTGSGCLSVTLALELPGSRVVAVDRSVGALAVSDFNRRRHGVADRVALVGGDLGEALDWSRFDLVVSNPPYVGEAERPGLSPEVVDFEPDLALFAGRDGMGIVRRIFAACAALAPRTPVALEIGAEQLDACRRAAEDGPLRLVEHRRDYAGRDRIVVLKRVG